MIKKFKIPILNSIFIFSIFILFSCKNAAEVKPVLNDENTLRNEISTYENEISWTKEIEEERLTSPVSVNEKISKNGFSPNPSLLKLLDNYNKPVFPELADFGNLDSSALSLSARQNIQNFCQTFSSNPFSGPESYFSSNYIFNYIFFKNDLIKGWKENFKTSFPYDEKQIAKINRQKEKNPKAKGVQVFSKWIFGQPFMGDKIIQLPVRFYCTSGTIDVTLHISTENSNKINQIKIDRWGK